MDKVKPAPFEYHAPVSLEEAVSTLADLGDAAKVLAGGQSLIPMLSLRLTSFDHLVDLGRIDSLRGVRLDGNGDLVIGAMTADRVVGSDSAVASGAPLLTMATPLIGHFQIRNRGTIGGSVAHADPAAEYPAVALALGAEIEAHSTNGTRRIQASEFFEATWTTMLRDDEVLTALRFPAWPSGSAFSIKEFARRHGDFAIVGAVAGIEPSNTGDVSRCAIALFGVGPTPVRASAAEEALAGRTPSDEDLAEVSHLAARDLDPMSDLHASGAYRTALAAELVRRALSEAWEGVEVA
jgi:aerobic carbon-monoxide dehydrogenase medium subunit